MQPAKQRHRHMRVPVDESGQHQPPASVDCLRPSVTSFDISLRPHRDNRVALDRDAATVKNPPPAIHRHYDPSADDEVNLLLRLRERSRNWREDHRQPHCQHAFQNRPAGIISHRFAFPERLAPKNCTRIVNWSLTTEAY